MKELLIMRHAKSSWKDPDLDDHDRPLNKRGQRDAPRMGKLIRDRNLIPDALISSPARRARTTAEMVVKKFDFDGVIELNKELYFGSLTSWLRMLQALPDDVKRAMIVGHNPGLEEFLELLTGQHERLPTAALAHVALPIDSWSELDANTPGKLVQIWRPKELDERK
ncbi:MAG: phosphoglycerate mutase [Gemmatales bacterium]|nr:MAG: phosphoglycerate mutase [Gemmatales bacterium]